MKNSFILYYEYMEHFELLSNEELGGLMRSIFEYEKSGKITADLSLVQKMAFSFIKKDLDDNRAKYDAKAEANKANGSKGGRPTMPETEQNPNNPVGYSETQNNPTVISETEQNPTEPKKADNVSVPDNVPDNVSVSDTTPKPPPPGEGPETAAADAEKNVGLQAKRFGDFWEAYPKKVGKEAALKAWRKIKPGAELFGKMIETIAQSNKSEQWNRENGRYVPNPATWLNQGRWDDEPRPSPPSPSWNNRYDPTAYTAKPGTGS